MTKRNSPRSARSRFKNPTIPCPVDFRRFVELAGLEPPSQVPVQVSVCVLVAGTSRGATEYSRTLLGAGGNSALGIAALGAPLSVL